MKEKAINVIVVDDHPVVLQGFSYMLMEMEHVELQATFETAKDAMDYLAANTTDIVLLDINLPDGNGIDICEEMVTQHPEVKVIAISNINEYSIIRRMLDSGASGYLLKNASAEEVARCIQDALAGKVAISKGVQAILADHTIGALPVVTRREREVLKLLAEGLNSTEIGERIFISPLTVESHRRNLLQKFSAVNVAALIHKATEMKYI